MALWIARLKVTLERGMFNDNAACMAVGHKLYCFGGANSEDGIIVRVFDTVSLSWTRPRVTASPGADIPRLRSYAQAVLIGHTVYLWGGYRPRLAPHYPNELYAFDVDTHVWFKPEVSGSAPQGRYMHSACALDEVMYIHGGRVPTPTFGVYYESCDVYALNTSTMAWFPITAKGPAALDDGPSRATIMGTKMVVLSWDGVRVFDTTTNLWNISSGSVPKMGHHSPFVYSGELYVFGQSVGNREWNGFEYLWKFNPKTNCTCPWHQTCPWQRVTTKGIKRPRYRTPQSFLVRDRVVLFGSDSVSGPLDVFVLDLSPSLKTLSKVAVIRHGLPWLELPRELRRELAAMTADGESAEA